MNDYDDPTHALAYLAAADGIPHRAEGEATLLSFVPPEATRILDLGTGDGRLLALLARHCPAAELVGLDGSPTMLDAARTRFAGDPRVAIVAHDLRDPLPHTGPLAGPFDAIVSSFAIHHCEDDRKRSLYAEAFGRLAPGGQFCNLEHVASPTAQLQQRFHDALDITEGDPGNILCDVQTQLGWLGEIGFDDVDCHWKWLELALLGARKPT